jgi:hypothetical protein
MNMITGFIEPTNGEIVVNRFWYRCKTKES